MGMKPTQFHRDKFTIRRHKQPAQAAYVHRHTDYQYTVRGGGFKYLLFSRLFGEDSHFDEYVLTGLKAPTSHSWVIIQPAKMMFF